MICENLKIKDGILYFGGVSCVDMIKKHGSPLYLMDEGRLRRNMRVYIDAMKEFFGEGSFPLLASKACSFKRIYQIANEEGMGTDVVSGGELYTALSSGFPREKIYFHGNNKTDADIAYGLDERIGCFVCDCIEEIDALDGMAGERGIKQKILIRLTPGIDPHTYAEVATGKVDSKFGSAIVTGAADKITAHALKKKNLQLAGFHCHVGSQVFDSEVYLSTAAIMLSFVADVKEKYGYAAEELNLGGGYGVRYKESDPVIDIRANIKEVAEAIHGICDKYSLKAPKIRFEPGRSIVADAGVTLYTVGSVKEIKGFKNYVSVDGGMADNPRYALYKSEYTFLLANKAEEERSFNCSVVGRCCESGDILGENIDLPLSVKRGDIMAVLTTGAYNYSMASNYNRLPRLPVVMIDENGDDYIAVRRESYEDLVRNDV